MGSIFFITAIVFHFFLLIGISVSPWSLCENDCHMCLLFIKYIRFFKNSINREVEAVDTIAV